MSYRVDSRVESRDRLIEVRLKRVERKQREIECSEKWFLLVVVVKSDKRTPSLTISTL